MRKIELLKKKGVYPYSYFDSFDRFDETELPPIEAYYKDLKGRGISENEYSRATEVYQLFGLRNLGELHDLYCSSDVLLLTNVMERYR